MFKSKTSIRVRYGETDQMGYLYYGYYAWYYEVGRVEALRELGISYKSVEEEDNVLMVVAECHSKYLRPAKYDEEIVVETMIVQMPKLGFLQFDCNLYNEKDDLINIGKVKLICVDKTTRKKTELPVEIVKALKPYFEEKN